MRTLIAGTAAALLALSNVAEPAVEAKTPRIQAAILLDTSNSMDGLIDQARGELWKVINELARAKRAGQRAVIEVALYEYGNARLSPDSGYVRRVVPFTTDLDKISEELFALETNGGDEWAGRALSEAVTGLEWSAQDADLRVAFVAGNEPFDQGPTPYAASIGRLRAKGVFVGTIFCGDQPEGEATHWRDAATLGKGSFMCIDQSKRVAYQPAPQDGEIARLGVELNDTYVLYGADGHRSWARQSAQDANAMGIGGSSLVFRSQVKASANYSNARWDLVDALREGKARASTLPEAELPEALRKLSPAERDAHVARQAARRADLQVRIARLSREREAFQSERQRADAGPAATLDSALVASIRELARDRGYSFE